MPVAAKLLQGGYIQWRAFFHKTTQPFDHTVLQGSMKNYVLDLFYNKAYDCQTWQSDDLIWKASTYKGTQTFEHVIVWGQVKFETFTPLPQCLWPPNLTRLLNSVRSFPP